MVNGDGTGETASRIQVCGKCYGTAGINHFTTACIRFFQCESRQRQQGSYYSCVGHCTDSGIGSLKQMIGRQSAQFGSQLSATKGNDFIGMEL